MEIHRLTVMQEDYDVEMFNRLYKSTTYLRKSLTFQIDSRRFGVSPDIIESWFSDKFIFVFNKHYGTMDEGRLKGYIINSLKTFKYRMLRGAYLKSNMFNSEIKLSDDLIKLDLVSEDGYDDTKDRLLKLAMGFMRTRLSPNALLVVDIELNPPLYISSRLKKGDTKIPSKLIAEYLDLDGTPENIRYINELRKEVYKTIAEANKYFKESVDIEREVYDVI